MEIQIAVAKASKFASIESGDTIEVVERPNGGVSVVLVDSRSSGIKAKAISISVVHKVIGLLAEGVKDGSVAKTASDNLFKEQQGKVSAYLNILSADLQTGTLIVTRNNPTPVLVSKDERIEIMGGGSSPIGISDAITPSISEIPLETGTTVVIYTDGVLNTGKNYRQSLDIITLLEGLLEEQDPNPQLIADTILTEAIRLDHGRPNDDMSVVVLRILSHESDQIRRMNLRLPVSRLDLYSDRDN